MKGKFVRICLILVVLVALAVAPTAALAKSPMQDPTPVSQAAAAAGEVVLDVALMVAITAFFKEQFALTGRTFMGVAFVVGVFLWGEPLVAAAFPAVGFYLDSFLAFVKVWLGAMGSVDAVTNIGAKIRAKAAKA